jgi:hypothetical protein
MWIHQQKIDDNHTDSFWYDGLIAETENFEMWANGDVEFTGDEPKDDKDIAKMYEAKVFALNNWFEILKKDEEHLVGGEVFGDYDSALEYLVETQKEYDNEQRAN